MRFAVLLTIGIVRAVKRTVMQYLFTVALKAR